MKRVLWVVMAVAIAACSSPEKEFKQAQAQDTSGAYQEFLRKNSSGPLADQARARIAALDAEHAWQQAEQLNSADAYEAYARQYPQSAQAADATERAATVRRAAAWDKTRADGTAASLRAFVDQYPQGPEADQARAQLAELDAAKAAQAKPPAKPLSAAAKKSGVQPPQAPTPGNAKSGGSYRVQLGAFRDGAAAERLVAKLRKEQGALLGTVVVVPPVKAKDVYRVKSGPMSEAAAHSACAKLQKEHLACVLVSG